MAIKSDGSVIIDTLVDTKGFNRGIGNMQKSVSGLTSSIGKIGVAISAAFGVHALVNFGKSAIDLGSDLAEVQNVVDVTFGEMSDSINKFASDAIEQFGLSEISAKRYASTMGAMLKSMGMQTSKALEMGKTLTGLAGDLASFYNLSSDEAFAKIRAGISGETEPLKQLGINLSVANLEAFALAEGITKSYNAMSEQEKVMLRYKYLLKTTADAQGDFARTSDGWANQVRILTEKFNSLKATIGQGFINVLTPLIKGLNTVLEKMQAVANAFKALTEQLFGKQEAQKAKENLSVIEEEYSNVADATNDAKKAQDSYLTGLDEINTFKTSDNGGFSDIAGGLMDAEITKESNDNLDDTEEIIANLQKRFPKLLLFLDNTGKKLKEIAEDFKLGNFSELGSDVSDLTVSIYNFISEAIEEVNWKDVGKKLGEYLSGIDWKAVLIAGLTLKFNIWEAIAEIWFGAFDAAPIETAILTALAALKFTGLGSILATTIGLSLVNALISLGGLGGILFTNMGLILGAGTLTEIGLLIGSALIGGIVASLLGWNLGQWLYEIINGDEVTMTFSEQMQAIIDSFKDGSWKGALELWGQDIKDTFSDIWDGIIKKAKSRINSLILLLNTMLLGVTLGINELINTLKSFEIEMPEWLEYTALKKFAGKTFTFNIPKVKAPQIPYLAKGAVIPPNAPFMAMLGDQKHGTNIEAPLATIEDALRNVLNSRGGMGVTGGSMTLHNVMQLNRRVLFEEFIEEAKLRQSISGRNPFDLE